MSLPEYPTHEEIDDFVSTATADQLKTELSNITPTWITGSLHPRRVYLQEQIEKRLKELETPKGGRSRSKKHPTARRRRSSKARKSRKSRKSRNTRRK